MDINKDRILVTGATGMVGRALMGKMLCRTNIIPLSLKWCGDGVTCDLRDETETKKIFTWTKPDYVFHLAARVGGIKANSDNLGDFFDDNIRINTNVLRLAKEAKVKKVLSLLSTCIYPNMNSSDYPLKEYMIHAGPPDQSNYAYAHAKRMLDVQSRAYRDQFGCNFITAVPNNLFGEHDNFDLEDSHVIPALIRKFHNAKLENKTSVVLWGTGKPLREFTYAGDLANILVFLMRKYNGAEPINVGNIGERSIKEVAEIIAKALQFKGEIIWDKTKPDGQIRKPSDNSKLLQLGWIPSMYIDFETAIKRTVKWYLDHYNSPSPIIRGI